MTEAKKERERGWDSVRHCGQVVVLSVGWRSAFLGIVRSVPKVDCSRACRRLDVVAEEPAVQERVGIRLVASSSNSGNCRSPREGAR